jgi:predicted RNA methylase
MKLPKPKKAKNGAPLLRKIVSVSRPTDTEVEAYEFIRRQLRDLGWIVRDPSKVGTGQVWTQNQCLAHAQIKAALGKTRPENIVKLSENVLWVIEAKASRKQLAQAIQEAVDDYAVKINNSPGQVRAFLATGVAGSEELGYLIRTKALIGGEWVDVTINGQVATGLLSPQQTATLLRGQISDVHDFVPPPMLFLSAAQRINEILHGGGIERNDRAKTIAALLLSVVEEPPNLDTNLAVLISDINVRSESVLRQHGKPEFAPFVRLIPPSNTDNHVKFKTALILTIQELLNLNIRAAMNSSTDVLGQFYEVFLKYGNGAKEIGIVLTPRHITRFAVAAVGVSSDDIVYDPACGTGGFLVAAFDYVRRNTKVQAQVDRFKKYNIFGSESASTVAALAIVNMIFRGDGKNNIDERNAFSTFLKKHTVRGNASATATSVKPPIGEEAVTRVLMNPPFASKGSEKEYRFVSQALSTMVDGKILFSLLPLGALFGAHDEKTWRTDELLASHTLLAVVTLPEELFYPAAQKQVAAIIVKKGVPHPRNQDVFWARVAHDGHLKLKSKRLPAAELRPPRTEKDQLPELLPLLQAFIPHPGNSSVNIPMFCKTAPIDYSDPLLELLPEAYLDAEPLTEETLQRAVDDMARQTAAFLVRFGKEAAAEDYK